jgi:predicted deacylase
MTQREPLTIGTVTVKPGRRAQVELPVAKLITGAEMAIPVIALHGTKPGPTVWISAAIHGDEINGVEIVNRVLRDLDPKTMSGTLLAVPVVNLYGFMTGDRYFPDRRDLNRSFPGSRNGSLASRVAHLFMSEIVERSNVGIDLHTASDHRTNLPQIRCDMNNDETRELAEVFGARLSMHSKNRSGSLRKSATDTGSTVLLYEAGEPWRFNDDAIEVGVAGIRRVLRHLDVAPWDGPEHEPAPISRSSRWIRAGKSGMAHINVQAGDTVEAGQVLGTIEDAFGTKLSTIRTKGAGLVIARTLYPLVNRGDALVHVATIVTDET